MRRWLLWRGSDGDANKAAHGKQRKRTSGGLDEQQGRSVECWRPGAVNGPCAFEVETISSLRNPFEFASK